MTDKRLDGGIPSGPVWRHLPALALVAMAAGCDQAQPAAEAGGRADVVAAAPAGDGQLDVALPAFAPAFSGARVVSRMSGMGGTGAGAVAVMEADAPFAEVRVFSNGAATRAGASAAMRVDKDGKAVRIFRGRDDRDGGTILVIEQGDPGRPTRVALTTGVTGLGIPAFAAPPPPPAPGDDSPRTAEQRPPATDVRLQ